MRDHGTGMAVGRGWGPGGASALKAEGWRSDEGGMASEMGSPWYRYLLAPAMLALLIGAPVASVISGEYGVSWMVVFVAVSGGMALFWDLALHRDEERARPLFSKSDPVFGPVHSYEPGLWVAQERAQMEGAWLQVSIEGGEEGPSTQQQDVYRAFLRNPSAYRVELMQSLVGRAGESTHPGLVPLQVFVPRDPGEADAQLEIEVMLDGDERGPHEEIVGFRDGRAMYHVDEREVVTDQVA